MGASMLSEVATRSMRYTLNREGDCAIAIIIHGIVRASIAQCVIDLDDPLLLLLLLLLVFDLLARFLGF